MVITKYGSATTFPSCVDDSKPIIEGPNVSQRVCHDMFSDMNAPPTLHRLERCDSLDHVHAKKVRIVVFVAVASEPCDWSHCALECGFTGFQPIENASGKCWGPRKSACTRETRALRRAKGAAIMLKCHDCTVSPR